MIRVPYFEDESGLVHIFSPEHHNFTRQTSDSFCMMADDLERFFSPALNDVLETGELAYGLNYEPTEFLRCRQVRQHLHFPHVVYWGPHALPTGERRHCSTHREPIHSSHMCEKGASFRRGRIFSRLASSTMKDLCSGALHQTPWLQWRS